MSLPLRQYFSHKGILRYSMISRLPNETPQGLVGLQGFKFQAGLLRCWVVFCDDFLRLPSRILVGAVPLGLLCLDLISVTDTSLLSHRRRDGHSLLHRPPH